MNFYYSLSGGGAVLGAVRGASVAFAAGDSVTFWAVKRINEANINPTVIQGSQSV